MAEPELAVTDLSEFRDRRATEAPEGPPPAPPSTPLPVGTVTFLLTDIEGSTQRWEAHGPEMAQAVERHYEILDAAISRHGGVRPIEQGEGDSLVAAFASASAAVAAALESQRALAAETWPEGAEVAVRMALHTGEAQLQDERYYVGPSIIRCARLRALAHGGQVLISHVTADLLVDGLPEGASLLPLGSHRLKDLRHPERLFQLAHPALPARFPPLRSLDLLPNNLPGQLTSFIGRDSELAELRALLGEHRLVTLSGAGGVGKTRLAAQVAAEVADAYSDGVWWVELAPLTDPDLVAQAVLLALGLLDTRGLDPLERIMSYLADRRVLLVFDNCEHVVASAASVIHQIQRACPGFSALATSREPLGVPGEMVWRVPPLSLPSGEDGQSADALLGSEAVRLFVERAVEARPTFRLEGANVGVVATICEHLDGIPLAIELAAARVRALSPERILDGLADRFRLLTGGARTAVPRQQTLQASVEWSHDLLSETERVLLRRLAAFSGSFSLDAAEDVCAGEDLEGWEILTVLSDLVDKSLVVFDGDRYRLLQTVRDFAADRLAGAGEADGVRSCQAAFFLARAEVAAMEMDTAGRTDGLVRLRADHDNLRSAIQWTLGAGDGERALRLVAALTNYWKLHGHFSEGLAWFRRVMAEVPAESSPLYARALWGLSHLSGYGMEVSGGYGFAERERAVTLARQLDDPAVLARLLADQGTFEVWLAPNGAGATLEEAIAAARAGGDQHALGTAVWWLAFYWIFDRDRPDVAGPILDELLAIANRSQSPYWLGWHHVVAGMTAFHLGRLDDARATLETALACAFELEERMLEAYAVGWLTEVLLARGDYDEARTVASRTAQRLRTLDECRQGWAEVLLAAVALAQCDLAEARRQLEIYEPIVTAWAIPFLIAGCRTVAGRLALQDSDLATARAAFEELSAIATQFDSPWLLVQAQHHLGRLTAAEGDQGAAEDSHHRALSVCLQYGLRGAAAETLEALGGLAVVGESHAEAARLLGAAQALREATGQQRWPLDQAAYDADLALAQTHIGADTFDQAWKEGTALSLEEAATYASRARGERKRPSTGWAALTPTELRVVALATEGLSNAQIGERLFMAAGTAKIHLSHIYAKLGVANRAQLAAQATAHELGAG